MKFRMTSAVLAVVLAMGVTPAMAASTISEADLLKLQEQFGTALAAGDHKAVAGLMADSGVFIHGNGHEDSRQEFVDAMIKNPVVQKFEIKNPKIAIYDGSAAIRAVNDVTVKTAQGMLVRHQYMSSVWVSTPGGWKLALLQQSAMSPATPAPAAH